MGIYKGNSNVGGTGNTIQVANQPVDPARRGQTPGTIGERVDQGSAIYRFVKGFFQRHPPQERSPCFPYGPLTQAMPFSETSTPSYYRDRVKRIWAKVFGQASASQLTDDDVKNIFLHYWAPRCESLAQGRRYSPTPGPQSVWEGEAAAIRRASEADFENLLRSGPVDFGTAPNYGGHGGDDPRPDPNAPYGGVPGSKNPIAAGLVGPLAIGGLLLLVSSGKIK